MSSQCSSQDEGCSRPGLCETAPKLVVAREDWAHGAAMHGGLPVPGSWNGDVGTGVHTVLLDIGGTRYGEIPRNEVE